MAMATSISYYELCLLTANFWIFECIFKFKFWKAIEKLSKRTSAELKTTLEAKLVLMSQVKNDSNMYMKTVFQWHLNSLSYLNKVILTAVFQLCKCECERWPFFKTTNVFLCCSSLDLTLKFQMSFFNKNLENFESLVFLRDFLNKPHCVYQFLSTSIFPLADLRIIFKLFVQTEKLRNFSRY